MPGNNRWRNNPTRARTATIYLLNPRTEEFLLIYHKRFCRWLPPGGHVKDDEHPIDAARRELEEELRLKTRIGSLKGTLKKKSGKDFRVVVNHHEPNDAFCVIEEFIGSTANQRPLIYFDHIYMAILQPEEEAELRDRDKVEDWSWFTIPEIQKMKTFDNVPVICEAILEHLNRR